MKTARKTARQITQMFLSLAIIFALVGTSGAVLAANTEAKEGTPIRLRLAQTITSSSVDENHLVSFEVLEDVKIGNATIIAQGALAVGTVVEAKSKRRFGRKGNLVVRFDYVAAVDGSRILLRALEGKTFKIKQQIENQSGGAATMTQIVSAAAFVGNMAIGPAVALPATIFKKGKDVGMLKGQLIDAYIETTTTVNAKTQKMVPMTPALMSGVPGGNSAGSELATVTFTSPTAGATVEVDGAFVGNTPSTVKLTAGQHSIVIKTTAGAPIVRNVMLTPGSAITITAGTPHAGSPKPRRAVRRR